MAYRMRVRRGSMSRLRRMGYRKRPLRVGRRVATRLKAIGRSDRFFLETTTSGTQSTSATKATIVPCNGFYNQQEREIFQIDRLRINWRFCQTIGTTNKIPDGLIAIWVANFDTGDGTANDATSEMLSFWRAKANALAPNMPTTRSDRRGMKLYRYREFAFPYLAKKSSDTRPDTVLAFHTNVKPFQLRPGQFILWGFSLSWFAGQEVSYQACTRVQATSGDIAGNNQAPLQIPVGVRQVQQLTVSAGTWVPIT